MSAAELEALARQADGAENDAGEGDAAAVQGGAAPAAPAPGNFEAIGFLVAAFREVASMLLRVESLKRTLADDKAETVARVLAPVADKYGLNLGGYLGGPEAVALMTAGPILWTAWKELDDELRARRAKPVEGAKVEPAGVADGGE